MSKKDHWEQVYSTRLTERLGWYKPHLQTTLSWIEGLGLDADAPIIDVGGGASTLAEDLLHAGYRSITVLDISEKALSSVKARLGKEVERVTWLECDITSVELPTDFYELWHDRAVFHFLTTPEQRRKYRANLVRALKPGGNLIVSTFAPEAPRKCSGLPVQRYNLKQLENTLGAEFELRQHHNELHITPGGVEQMYLYCHFRKTG
ncbi:class I SAM-dependent methyltransferase [Gammaproteobacteria bacterium]|nr:class I SAM-dependent methyltransferase [Gammaproteobacteria bacterium]